MKHADAALTADPALRPEKTGRIRISKILIPVHRPPLDFPGHRWVRPGEIRVSATAAKVDPHLLVPGAGVALLGSLDAAGDEVGSAVPVPVRHANAAGLPVFVVGDEQL